MPKSLRISMIVAVTFGLITIFGLVISSADTHLFERYFKWLFIVNVLLIIWLGAMVGSLIWRQVQRYRNKTFGSYITLRLTLITGLIAFIPVLAIYGVSTQIINRSIDSWFDQRVESALDSGVQISRSVLQAIQQNTEQEAKRISETLVGIPNSRILPELLRELNNRDGLEAFVFTGNGQPVATAGTRVVNLIPDSPSMSQIQTAKANGVYAVVDGDAFDTEDKGTIKIRVIVPIASINEKLAKLESSSSGLFLEPNPSASQQLFLQLIQSAPEGITHNAKRLVEGYREYQEMVLNRSSLHTIYQFTLTLALLLTLFIATTAAIAFARRSTEPLLQLERGTRRLANGEFTPIKSFPGHNELNALTRSFNTMVDEIKAARHSLETERLLAQQAKAFLEEVLSRISSGVMVLTIHGTVLNCNSAAQHILNQQKDDPTLTDLDDAFVRMIIEKAKQTVEGDKFQFEYELRGQQKSRPLYVQGRTMPIGEVMGIVVVFDDLTKLIEAQRATAWGEVARRLAHEIKNPLTPIRLSAERLAYKLEGKLADEKDAALLTRMTNTIVMQVDALAQMINDFREYAKLPSARLRPLNLNEFIQESIDLYKDAGFEIITHYDWNLPTVMADASQFRQVLHNLISNAIEAQPDGQKAKITITTLFEPQKHTRTSCGTAKLIIQDNGLGFREDVLEAAFEPYVTTKPTGSGLGLPMVKKILDEHEAHIELSNQINPATHEIAGAQITITMRTLAPQDEMETT